MWRHTREKHSIKLNIEKSGALDEFLNKSEKVN